MSGEPKDPEFIKGLPFFGGSLWLNLVNTTMRSGPERQDLIASDDGFADWLDAAHLPLKATMAPGDAKEQLISLRERLRPMVALLGKGEAPPVSLIDEVNVILSQGQVRIVLQRHGKAYRLVEVFDAGDAGPKGAVAADFARFLCESEPERLRRCSNPACTMVFYDTSKNNTRRWCSMSICGNRDKVARFRARRAHSPGDI